MMNKCKFGVSYNVFDGEELLEDSIKCIRGLVDYISVVYQTKSNYGNPCSNELLNILDDLLKRGLINEIQEYIYNPTLGPHRNEINKRNIGLNLSKINGCTHHMTMDCDEFYTEEQFQYLIKWHENNPEYVSFCQLVSYYKDSQYLIDEEDKTNVTLFFPIKNETLFVMGYPTPVLIDPTRKPNCSNYHVFSFNEVIMHHMTMVRKDIRSKLINSSALVNYNSGNKINEIIDFYNNWSDGDDLVGLKTSGFFNIKRVESKFKINI